MRSESRKIWSAWPTYVGFLVVGLCLLVIGYVLVPGTGTVSSSLADLAVAFIVGGFTGFIHTFYLEKEIRTATYGYEMERLGEHMHFVGIRDIFPRRPLKEIRAALGTARYSIRIVGSSLKGLVGAESPNPDQEAIFDALIYKARRGVRLRLLQAHPCVAHFREKLEIHEKGAIQTEIIESLIRLLGKLPSKGKSNDSWSLRLYECDPTVFCIEIDERTLFLEPYPLGGTAMDNLCLKTEISSHPGNLLWPFMVSHFDAAWERSTCEIRQKTDLEPIVQELVKQDVITLEQRRKLEVFFVSKPG